MLPPRWRSKEITEPVWGYMAEIYKIIYLTNMIKGLNRQFRQITKDKPSFTAAYARPGIPAYCEALASPVSKF